MFIYTIRSKYSTKAYINYSLEKVSLNTILNRYKQMYKNGKLKGLVNVLFTLGECYISILNYYLLRPSIDELYTEINQWNIFFNNVEEQEKIKETEKDIIKHNLKVIEQQEKQYKRLKEPDTSETSETSDQEQDTSDQEQDTSETSDQEPEDSQDQDPQVEKPQADRQEEPQEAEPQEEPQEADNQQKIMCVICNLKFKTKYELNKHKRIKSHKKNKSKLEGKAEEPQKHHNKEGYYCGLCNVTLKNKRSRYSHYKTTLHKDNLKKT